MTASPINSKENYCEKHDLFYIDKCSKCNKPQYHICDLKGYCATHEFYFCLTCSYCRECKKDCNSCLCKVPNTEKRYFCAECNFWYCYMCSAASGASLYINCPNCIKAKTQKKNCGCPYNSVHSQYCYLHQHWYCELCTNGKDKCPKCNPDTLVSRSILNLPDCKCYNQGVRHKGSAAFCPKHDVWYCKTCNILCPKCKEKGMQAERVNANIYPLKSCTVHGLYCSKCEVSGCPDCNNKAVRCDIKKCNNHNNDYCSFCGLGCKKCGGVIPDNNKYLICLTCRAYALCECEKNRKHGYYCLNCDGNCTTCEGWYVQEGVMHHFCGKPMEYCKIHKKHFCNNCKTKCLLCKEDKCNICKEELKRCFWHPKSVFCYKCKKTCSFCVKEVEESGKLKHGCGEKLLYCPVHDAYFCPVCDFLTECYQDCGVRERLHKDKDHNLLEDRWTDFEAWEENRKELLDCLVGFQETWDSLENLLTSVYLCTTEDDPASEQFKEQFMFLNKVFKDLTEITSKLDFDEIYPTKSVRLVQKIKIKVIEFLEDHIYP